MGNHIKDNLYHTVAENFAISELNFKNALKYSFIFIGLAQSLNVSFRLIKNIKESISPDHHNLHLEGKKKKWAFILNSTSEMGYVISKYLAERDYNLILASFEGGKLDEIKATIFMKFPEISIEAYYLYKTDMKNFEEKFHFRDFLQKYDVEIFIFNDCLLKKAEIPDFLEYDYEELQYELSKKFLLKTFLFKIVLENYKKKHLKNSVVFNINDVTENHQLEMLSFMGYEEFLKNHVEDKYGKEFDLKVFNIFNDLKITDEEIYKDQVIKKIFGN